MKECPQCGNTFSESYQYCPIDGVLLSEENGNDRRKSSRKPAQIRVKTLVLGLVILMLCALISFTATFYYLSWKPKYGGLTIQTTPPGALISIDGKLRGASPITLSNLLSGGHQLKATRDGYKEFVQQVTVMPFITEPLHWKLEPIVPQLSNEQLAEVEAWRKKLDSAQKENILLPPPDDYNALFFANKILSIDPANSYATEVKTRLADTARHLAELAYAREDWLESEKQYKNLELLFPNDSAISERLADVATKLDASVKDREKQIQDWRAKAEASMKAGNLLPPDKENALDAIRSIQRLDKDNSYVRGAISQLKELLQNRGDAKITASDWRGARNDFRLILQYFPEDSYSKTRLTVVDAKIAELALLEKQRANRANEEQQSRQKISALRQSALNSFRTGVYGKSISEWQEYLKAEPNSDEAYFYIGASYQDQKQLDTAILNFEKCLSLNPNHVLAHLNLGLLYDYHRNNYKLAEEHLRKAKELGGGEKYTPDRLQAMIQDLKDRAEVKTVLKLLIAVAVEHKHAISSCRGNLTFTEEGIEYRTTETDHSFYEIYKSVRAFTLEGKDLSIKNHDNKKYNFRFQNAGDADRVRTWISSTRYIRIDSKAE
jgi:tetratricopeptide (TPR) repeat protein